MSRSIRLRPLFNLNYLIGNQAMGFAMDRICSLFIWRFDQAKDLAALLVKPVAQVLDAVLLLCPQVGFMGLGNRIRGQSFDMSVRIHIQWHEISPYKGARPANAASQNNSNVSRLKQAQTYRSERYTFIEHSLLV
jgi:hypothetical protein